MTQNQHNNHAITLKELIKLRDDIEEYTEAGGEGNEWGYGPLLGRSACDLADCKDDDIETFG